LNKPWINAYDKEVSAHLEYPDIPVYRFLLQSADSYPEKCCLTFRDVQFSYQKTLRLVNSLARAMESIGVSKGDRVGIVMGNIPQFVLCYYAVLRAGGIVVATNPMYKERELRYQLSNTGCKVVITTLENYALVKKVQPETSIQQVVVTDLNDYEIIAGEPDCDNLERPQLLMHDRYLLDLFCEFMNEEPETSGVGGGDAAIFQYSGGTTGIPKAAIGLHRNLVANTLQFRHWLHDLKEGQETVLAAIPLYHVYGMVIAMSMGIALGANLVLIPNPRDIEDVLRNIAKYEATIFPGVPNMYQAINRFSQVHQYDLSSIKACISGSAPLLREVKEQFEDLTGGKLLEGYGLSEAPTATHCNPYMGENRTGSIGLPLPDVDCRVVSLADGKTDVPAGEAGELLVKSPQVMQGYHGLAQETQEALTEGWLHTGDIARMDGDGYFYLIDRKKDVIKASGFQVWPREVEEVLMEHPAVLEAAVAGVMDPHKGETVRAWVVLKAESEISGEKLRNWCRERLANYKVPAQIEFLSQLPRTNVGKVLRRELVRQYNEAIRK
jgi:long-chain acyl-CoA synthetase